jgi:hypothetical protein
MTIERRLRQLSAKQKQLRLLTDLRAALAIRTDSIATVSVAAGSERTVVDTQSTSVVRGNSQCVVGAVQQNGCAVAGLGVGHGSNNSETRKRFERKNEHYGEVLLCGGFGNESRMA